MSLVFLQPPVQYISARLYAKLRSVCHKNIFRKCIPLLHRLKSAKVTDKRVRVMNEIISGMRLIKMYAWEWAFYEYVRKIRKLLAIQLKFSCSKFSPVILEKIAELLLKQA